MCDCDKTLNCKCVKRNYIREFTWKNTMGEIVESMCPVCQKNNINVNNFYCGYLITKSRGGITEFSNLSPICRKCNEILVKEDENVYDYTVKTYNRNPVFPTK